MTPSDELALDSTLRELEDWKRRFEVEQAKRIAAETLAVERGRELQRWQEQSMRFEDRYYEASQQAMKNASPQLPQEFVVAARSESVERQQIDIARKPSSSQATMKAAFLKRIAAKKQTVQ